MVCLVLDLINLYLTFPLKARSNKLYAVLVNFALVNFALVSAESLLLASKESDSEQF